MRERKYVRYCQISDNGERESDAWVARGPTVAQQLHVIQ